VVLVINLTIGLETGESWLLILMFIKMAFNLVKKMLIVYGFCESMRFNFSPIQQTGDITVVGVGGDSVYA
jgi:hypothetical protein